MYFCNSGTGYENKMMQYVSTGNPDKGKKKYSGFEQVSKRAIKHVNLCKVAKVQYKRE